MAGIGLGRNRRQIGIGGQNQSILGSRCLEFGLALNERYSHPDAYYGGVSLTFPEEEQTSEFQERTPDTSITNLYQIQNLKEENQLFQKNLTFLTNVIQRSEFIVPKAAEETPRQVPEKITPQITESVHQEIFQNTYQDVNQIIHQNITQILPREIKTQLREQIREQKGRRDVQEFQYQIPRQIHERIQEQVPGDAVRQLSPELRKEIQKQLIQQVQQKVIQQVQQDTIETVRTKVTKEIKQEVTQILQHDTSKVVQEKLTEVIPTQIRKVLQETLSETVTQKTNKELVQQVQQKVTEQIQRELTEEVTKHVQLQVTEQIQRDITEQVHRNITEQVHHGITQQRQIEVTGEAGRHVTPRRQRLGERKLQNITKRMTHQPIEWPGVSHIIQNWSYRQGQPGWKHQKELIYSMMRGTPDIKGDSISKQRTELPLEQQFLEGNYQRRSDTPGTSSQGSDHAQGNLAGSGSQASSMVYNTLAENLTHVREQEQITGATEPGRTGQHLGTPSAQSGAAEVHPASMVFKEETLDTQQSGITEPRQSGVMIPQQEGMKVPQQTQQTGRSAMTPQTGSSATRQDVLPLAYPGNVRLDHIQPWIQGNIPGVPGLVQPGIVLQSTGQQRISPTSSRQHSTRQQALRQLGAAQLQAGARNITMIPEFVRIPGTLGQLGSIHRSDVRTVLIEPESSGSPSMGVELPPAAEQMLAAGATMVYPPRERAEQNRQIKEIQELQKELKQEIQVVRETRKVVDKLQEYHKEQEQEKEQSLVRAGSVKTAKAGSAQQIADVPVESIREAVLQSVQQQMESSINQIAGSVYRRLEKRLETERDRRGLR